MFISRIITIDLTSILQIFIYELFNNNFSE